MTEGDSDATRRNQRDPLDDFAPDVDGLTQALDRLTSSRTQPGHPHPDAAALPSEWPSEGAGGVAALSALADIALDRPARLDHPGFLAHMDPPTPWFTWAATQWAAATNQNLLHPDVAPQMRRLEERVVEWLAPAFDMSGGHLVPGSTIANLTALWAARDLCGVTEVVSSSAAHLSIAKAAHLLGLSYRRLPALSDGTLDAAALGDLHSSALVLTAGTVSSGAVDDLSLAHPQPDRAAWVHVDAAWAGPLRFSDAHAGALAGVGDADSVGFSAHKWLHQPKECAAVLFADVDQAHQALSFGGSYLSAPNIGLLGSTGARALPLATTLLAWGRSGVAAVIEAGMERIAELHQLVETSSAFCSAALPKTGVLLWRPNDRTIDLVDVQRQLSDAWVSLAVVDDEPWFRSVGANPTADPHHVIDEVSRAVDAARGR